MEGSASTLLTTPSSMQASTNRRSSGRTGGFSPLAQASRKPKASSDSSYNSSDRASYRQGVSSRFRKQPGARSRSSAREGSADLLGGETARIEQAAQHPEGGALVVAIVLAIE